MSKIKVENVSYAYRNSYRPVQVLKDISVSFEEGKFYAITGESGSGKSTLLSLLAGLDLPQEGQIYVNEKEMKQLDRDQLRQKDVAVIYQAFQLFPLLNALENVMYPMELNGIRKAEARQKAQKYLRKVGLADRIEKHFPKTMSGGEQQRVAIARAMAAGGDILLADEPTGNLDSENEENIIRILRTLVDQEGYTVILVTHNQKIAELADVQYQMKDGRLLEKEA
ncbi:MAG: ABC transporter ATP-binding protein [Hespellia sp.]|nr:ABC transporter ATP-binding protein [Hespellia sp.]